MRIATVLLGAALATTALPTTVLPTTVLPTTVLPTAAAAPATGTVLEQSAVPAADLPSGAVRGVKVLYATRDENGRPARSTGVVYYPRGTAPAGGWKVVSWAHGTSGISAPCAPSGRPGKFHDANQPTIAGALRRGYVVTASDYIGLGGGGTAEYLGGRSVAYNVIDMVRAARGIDPAIGRRWVSLGHSQGGHAALWAARVAPRYAPELPVLGTVALAPVSQITTIVPAMQDPHVPDFGAFNQLSVFGLYVLSGLDHARPEVHAQRLLTPAGRYWLAQARTTCLDGLGARMRSVTPGSLYARAATSSPSYMSALARYGDIPATGFTRPVRLQQGLTDYVVTPAATAVLEGQLRRGGAAVSMGVYPGDHMGVTRQSLADTMATVARYFR
ncbi:lipase family protein [Gordonia crocea]|uniref:Lipase n=1 Tax=Gordonia crocea TaxID=589162 RepID=A0A7I9UW22_9ACTN|nr:lipase family protein [Gordonia crocea]GED97036.1 lipase [Gordonia crocea]